MTAHALYYRDGRQITEEEALNANGAIRDHVTIRVPLTMRDSLSPLQRAIAASTARDAKFTDGRTNDPTALNRPGWRIRVGDNRQAIKDALAEYQSELVNRWRKPKQETSHDALTEHESYEAPHRADARTLDQMVRDHRVNMQQLHAMYDAEISQMWRPR